MDTTNWKILQIVPADLWVAHFRDDNKKESEEKIACWALVTDGEKTFTTGIVMAGSNPGMGSFAAGLPNFNVYRPLR